MKLFPYDKEAPENKNFQDSFEPPNRATRNVFKWTIYLLLTVFGTVVALIMIDSLNNPNSRSEDNSELNLETEKFDVTTTPHNTPLDIVPAHEYDMSLEPFVSDLEERASVKTILTTSATTFFLALAYGTAYGPIGAALLPYVGEVGNFILASLFGSAAAGIGTYGGVNAWEWYKGSSSAGEKRELLEEKITVGGFNMFHSDDHFSEMMGRLSLVLGEDSKNIGLVKQVEVVHNPSEPSFESKSLNDSSAPIEQATNHTLWVYNHGNLTISTVIVDGDIEDSARALNDHIRGTNETINKRYDNGAWFSFNTYGMNPYYSEVLTTDGDRFQEEAGPGVQSEYLHKVQPCSNDPRCYAVANKGCVAASHDSKGPGIDSDIVGEYYYNSYGGVDGECDSI